MASHIGAPSNRINYHHAVGSRIRCTPDNFGKEMVNIFKMFAEDINEGIIEETRSTANDGADLLKMIRQPEASEGGSAKPMKRRQWKRYSNSWFVEEREGTNYYHATIRNRRHYRLTHLLEYGHVTRNGTRTRAFRHIEPVDLYCVNRLETNIPKIIQNGGK